MWVGTALFAQVVGVLAVYATGLKVLVLPLGRTLLVVALVVVMTAIVAELVRLVLAMMMTSIVAILALGVHPMAPGLAGKMLAQFA